MFVFGPHGTEVGVQYCLCCAGEGKRGTITANTRVGAGMQASSRGQRSTINNAGAPRDPSCLTLGSRQRSMSRQVWHALQMTSWRTRLMHGSWTSARASWETSAATRVPCMGPHSAPGLRGHPPLALLPRPRINTTDRQPHLEFCLSTELLGVNQAQQLSPQHQHGFRHIRVQSKHMAHCTHKGQLRRSELHLCSRGKRREHGLEGARGREEGRGV